jgi:ADP-ribosylglycohydrolase
MLSFEEAVAAARADACLTHPNLTCQWASAAYVVAIRHLLLHPSDGAGAFAEAECVLNRAPDDGIIEVQSWLKDAAQGRLPDCYPLAGFVRIAFTHAFHHLHCGTPFEDALRQVLAGGGDTDTNACIVGGLVGARVGLQALPEQMSRAVLECDTTKGQPRPCWLQTRDAMTLATALLT